MTTFLNQVEEKWWQSDINTVTYDENTEQNRLSNKNDCLYNINWLDALFWNPLMCRC